MPLFYWHFCLLKYSDTFLAHRLHHRTSLRLRSQGITPYRSQNSHWYITWLCCHSSPISPSSNPYPTPSFVVFFVDNVLSFSSLSPSQTMKLESFPPHPSFPRSRVWLQWIALLRGAADGWMTVDEREERGGGNQEDGAEEEERRKAAPGRQEEGKSNRYVHRVYPAHWGAKRGHGKKRKRTTHGEKEREKNDNKEGKKVIVLEREDEKWRMLVQRERAAS